MRRYIPADGEKNLQVSIRFFEEIQLLYASIYIVADVVPAVCWVVLLQIGIGISENAVMVSI